MTPAEAQLSCFALVSIKISTNNAEHQSGGPYPALVPHPVLFPLEKLSALGGPPVGVAPPPTLSLSLLSPTYLPLLPTGDRCRPLSLLRQSVALLLHVLSPPRRTSL